jgi:hypothetical protein
MLGTFASIVIFIINVACGVLVGLFYFPKSLIQYSLRHHLYCDIIYLYEGVIGGEC